MQAANRFLKDLKASKLVLGVWQMFPSPSASRTMARVPGISWVLVDQEHGNVSDSAMHECIANIAPYGVSPLVRIPDSSRWMIKRALDAGAHGIMVPLLNTVQEVEEVVQQVQSHDCRVLIESKFPPSGMRGLGSPFSINAFELSNIGDYLSQANDNTAVIIQIETLQAYENVEAIAKVEGVGTFHSNCLSDARRHLCRTLRFIKRVGTSSSARRGTCRRYRGHSAYPRGGALRWQEGWNFHRFRGGCAK